MGTDHKGADRGAIAVGSVGGDAATGATGKDEAADEAVRRGRAARIAVTVVGVLLVAWFFVAWLLLERHIVDAAGESVGTAFGIMVVVSVIGAVRGRGRG
jgi:hypothetical protein